MPREIITSRANLESAIASIPQDGTRKISFTRLFPTDLPRGSLKYKVDVEQEGKLTRDFSIYVFLLKDQTERRLDGDKIGVYLPLKAYKNPGVELSSMINDLNRWWIEESMGSKSSRLHFGLSIDNVVTLFYEASNTESSRQELLEVIEELISSIPKVVRQSKDKLK